MRICPKCGFKIENDEAKFCKKRGSRLPEIEKIAEGTIHTSNDNGVTLNPRQESLAFVKKTQVKNIEVDKIPKQHDIPDIRLSHEEHVTNRNMMWAVKTCFKKYAKFEGRASRSEYWYFALFNNLIFFIPVLLAFAIDHDVISPILCIAAFIYLTATIIPGLSVSVRRLHDVGKSGYFYFICCIPYIGGFILLYYFCKASEIGENIYGKTY